MTRILLVVAVGFLATAGSAQASCAEATDEEKTAFADVVFEGVALPAGRSIDGVLISPARFRVTRYLKGDGPTDVWVNTALIADGAGRLSEGIEPGPGQEWRIFGSRRAKLIVTSICSGSGLIDGSSTASFMPQEAGGAAGYVVAAVAILVAALGAFFLLRRRAPSAPA